MPSIYKWLCLLTIVHSGASQLFEFKKVILASDENLRVPFYESNKLEKTNYLLDLISLECAKNSEKLKPNHRIKFNLIIGGLEIDRLQANDSGHYTCLTKYADLSIEDQYEPQSENIQKVWIIDLTVYKKIQYMNLSLSVKDKNNQRKSDTDNKEVGDQINAECCVNLDASPRPQLVWRKHITINKTLNETFELVDSNREVEDKLCARLSTSVDISQNEFYWECFASQVNDKSNEMKYQQLLPSKSQILAYDVEYRKVFTSVSDRPDLTDSVMLFENSLLDLTCKALAYPPITKYTWFWNSLIISNESTLRIDEVKRNQSGIYECIAGNALGNTSSKIEITIQYVDLNGMGQERLFLQTTSQTAITRSIYLNKSTSFVCDLNTSARNPSIQWHHFRLCGHRRLAEKSMSNYLINTETLKNSTIRSVLQVNSAKIDDLGFYICSTNSTHEDSMGERRNFYKKASYYLILNYAPILNKVPKKIYSNDVINVKAICNVTSHPKAELSWFRVGRNALGLQERHSIHHYISNTVEDSCPHQTTTASIMLPDTYGDYECVANNVIGKTVQVINIRPKKIPESITEFAISYSDSFKLVITWTSGSYADESSKFILNINDLNNETIIDESRGDNHNLTIYGLIPEYKYRFKILAFNSLGYGQFSRDIAIRTPTASLITHQLPKITSARFDQLRTTVCLDLQTNVINENFVLTFYLKNCINDSCQKPQIFWINSSSVKYQNYCLKYQDLVNNKGGHLMSFDAPNSLDVRKSEEFIELDSARLSQDFFSSNDQVSVAVCLRDYTTICTQRKKVLNSTLWSRNWVSFIASGLIVVSIILVSFVVKFKGYLGGLCRSISQINYLELVELVNLVLKPRST